MVRHERQRQTNPLDDNLLREFQTLSLRERIAQAFFNFTRRSATNQSGQPAGAEVHAVVNR